MVNHHTYLRWRTLLLVASVMLLAACSATRLAYNNLDWLIGWKVDDYISLDRSQKRWLASRTRQHLTWHCSTELPRYLSLMDQLEPILYDANLDAAILVRGLPQVEAAADRLLLEIAPTVTGLLRQLDAGQVNELTINLQEKQRELEEKYTGPDLTIQHQERIERAQERLEDWLGPLNRQQYARLSDWAAQLQGHNGIWLKNRQAWQQAFVQALASRHENDFDQRIISLLTDRERYWITDFKRIAAANREHGTRLAADLVHMASDKQKAHLTRRFDDLRSDIEALRCSRA